MKWLKDHTKFAVVALVIIILSGFCVASYLSIGSGNWLGRTAETALQWVQKPIMAVGESVKNSVRGLFRYQEVIKENDVLRDKLNELNDKYRDSKLYAYELQELRELRDFLNDNQLEDYPRVTTNVTALDNSGWFTTLTIGAGTDDGVEENDVVVSSEGLIGRVTEVGPAWAKVICIIHDNSNVSFRAINHLENVGILTGAGDGTLSGYFLSTKATVEIGEELITSGMELYPEGIVIGTVTRIRKDPDSHLTYITVEPTASFQTIQTVTVIQTNRD